MSIWSSIGLGEDQIMGLDYDEEAAYYRGEGEPTVEVDVATTGWHDHIRLSIGDDTDVLLSVEAVRRLAGCLIQAADRADRAGSGS